MTVTFELRSEAGPVIGSYTLDRQPVEKPKDRSVYAFAPNLSLEDVPPGRYVIHVTARSLLDKKKSITRDIPFSVR